MEYDTICLHIMTQRSVKHIIIQGTKYRKMKVKIKSINIILMWFHFPGDLTFLWKAAIVEPEVLNFFYSRDTGLRFFDLSSTITLCLGDMLLAGLGWIAYVRFGWGCSGCLAAVLVFAIPLYSSREGADIFLVT